MRAFTLVELILALLAAAVVGLLAMRAFRHFAKSSATQQSAAVLQQEMTTAANLMEKDTRSAGYGLPGTGVAIDLAGGETDSVHLFSNPQDRRTRLIMAAGVNDTALVVADAQGLAEGQYVCIENGTWRFYHRVRGTAPETGGWTVSLAEPLAAECPIPSTVIHFAVRTTYYLDRLSSPVKLTRRQGDAAFVISSSITAFSAAARTETDSVLTSDYGRARTLTFGFGGGGSGRAEFMQDSVTAIIRNFQ